MTNVLTGNAQVETYGRIATFTWPAMSHKDLDLVVKQLNLRTQYPRMGLAAATIRAAQDEADTQVRASGWKLIVRTLNNRVNEFIREVVVPANDGEVKGDRATIARVLVKDGNVSFDAYNEDGAHYIEERAPIIRENIHYYQTTVQANDVGDWADTVVKKEFHGLPLDNRGHSFHVTGTDVLRFDSFIELLTSLSDGKEQLAIFKSVDTDAASIASLVRSLRSLLSKGIDKATSDMGSVRTKRGIDGILSRLEENRSLLKHYQQLLGNEVDAMLVDLENAEGAIAGAEVVKDFGGLDDK